jgi:flagellar basal body L-ring protein FlgH
MMRKKRSDRTHVVYMLEHGADFYIGVTAKTESTPLKSVKTRWNKHCYRANTEDKSWLLYEKLRAHDDGWTLTVVAVIRGKAEAHARERELIRELRPNLNTDVRVRQNG